MEPGRLKKAILEGQGYFCALNSGRVPAVVRQQHLPLLLSAFGKRERTSLTPRLPALQPKGGLSRDVYFVTAALSPIIKVLEC